MRPEAKSLKIVSIITMFVGIIFAILGIVLTVRGAGIRGIGTIVSGVLGAFIGVRGSLLANVPSTAHKIVVPAIVCGLVGVALAVVYVATGNDDPSGILGCVVPGLFCACVSILGQNLKKALERI